jgi:hypothetical protein
MLILHRPKYTLSLAGKSDCIYYYCQVYLPGLRNTCSHGLPHVRASCNENHSQNQLAYGIVVTVAVSLSSVTNATIWLEFQLCGCMSLEIL